MIANPRSPSSAASPKSGEILQFWPVSALLRPYSKEPLVEKIDGFKLYNLGAAISPITHLRGGASWSLHPGTTYGDAFEVLAFAELVLREFLKDNTFNLQVSLKAGNELLRDISELRQKVEDGKPISDQLKSDESSLVQVRATNFLNLIKAELPTLPLYLVSKKGGYTTNDLIEHGEVFFPNELVQKVPDALRDIREGTKCIAFELPTAAGYHLHRANEAVLRKYWDFVTGGLPRANITMGGLIAEMNNRGIGSPVIKATLRDIVKHHRNPLAHPDEKLDNVNEAIALMGIIQTAIVQVLKELP